VRLVISCQKRPLFLQGFFIDKDVKILVDGKSFMYLYGTELDFSDGLNGKGFAFNNPNASRSCGCGESFAV
jgi:iron-sulfur cluster assembly protein